MSLEGGNKYCYDSKATRLTPSFFLGCEMVKITYFGSEKDIAKAAAIINRHRSLKRLPESKARLKIQGLIDKHSLKASILVNGNTVWSKRRILTNLQRIMKHGTLYNEDQRKPPILSHYFYQFLHQTCGGIAHYDIYGWIHKYPTVDHLRQFFKKNELGKRVLNYIPESQADAREIIQDIETMLFPFETYLKTRNHQ